MKNQTYSRIFAAAVAALSVMAVPARSQTPAPSLPNISIRPHLQCITIEQMRKDENDGFKETRQQIDVSLDPKKPGEGVIVYQEFGLAEYTTSLGGFANLNVRVLNGYMNSMSIVVGKNAAGATPMDMGTEVEPPLKSLNVHYGSDNASIDAYCRVKLVAEKGN